MATDLKIPNFRDNLTFFCFNMGWNMRHDHEMINTSPCFSSQHTALLY